MIHWFSASTWFAAYSIAAFTAQIGSASLKSAFDSALYSESPASSAKTLALEMILVLAPDFRLKI